jgi:hypothetical protein
MQEIYRNVRGVLDLTHLLDGTSETFGAELPPAFHLPREEFYAASFLH